jgi:hypothetical protein
MLMTGIAFVCGLHRWMAKTRKREEPGARTGGMDSMIALLMVLVLFVAVQGCSRCSPQSVVISDGRCEGADVGHGPMSLDGGLSKVAGLRIFRDYMNREAIAIRIVSIAL